MPATPAPAAATWRSHPCFYMGHVWLLAPETIFRARVNMPGGATVPIKQVTFDTVTIGSDTDIRAGMTIAFGSAAGLWDLGVQRVKSATSSTVDFGRSSRGVDFGEVNIADDIFIDVLDDFREWAKIPAKNSSGAVKYKDGDIVVGDYGSEPPPVANGGVGFIGFVDEITELITVEFPNGSFAVAEGATLVTYLWEIDDGTFTVGTSASATPTATFPEGFRNVHLTVEDSNGKTHTCHIPVMACTREGANAPLSAFEVNRESYRVDGHTFSLRVLENIPASTYPDGTLCMYFEEEFYGDGTKGSLTGPEGREHVKFIGWLHRNEDSIQRDREGLRRDTVIECLDAAARLQKLPGFTQVVKKKGSPDEWQEMTTPDINKYFHHLLHWHGTGIDLSDWQWAELGALYEFRALGSDGSNLYAQVDKRGQAIAHRFTCDKRGRLWIMPDPQLANTISEPAITRVALRTDTVIIDLTEDDILDIQYAHEHSPRVHWHRGNAVMADEDRIWSSFAIAPGEAPGQGEQADETGQQLAWSKDELFAREGHRYARLNAKETFFDVTLAHGGDIDIDPAYMEWITITLSAQYAAQRGLNWTEARFLVHEVEIVHRNERTGRYKDVRLRVEKEVYGFPAEDDEIIEGGANVTIYGTVNTTPVFVPPAASSGGGPSSFGLYKGVGVMGIVCGNHVYLTADFPSASPTWEQFVPGFTGGQLDAVVDAFSPRYISGGDTDEVNLWTFDDFNCTRIEDVFDVGSGRTVTPQNVTLVNQGRAQMDSPFSTSGYIAHVQHVVAGKVQVSHSEDGGATWSLDDVSAFTIDHAAPFDLFYCTRVHRIYCGGASATGVGDLYKSDDSGFTWDRLTTFADHQSLICIHVPWHDNPASELVYYSTIDASTVHHLYRYQVGGARVDITPTVSGLRVIPFRHWGLTSHVSDRRRMAMIGLNAFGGSNPLLTSLDGGDTWTVKQAITSYTHVFIAGDDGNVLYLWGPDGSIGYSQDFGETIQDKTGNLADFSESGEVERIFGG